MPPGQPQGRRSGTRSRKSTLLPLYSLPASWTIWTARAPLHRQASTIQATAPTLIRGIAERLELRREADLRARSRVALQVERAAELVAHEGADDRETRPLRRLGGDALAVVGDLEQHLPVDLVQRDQHARAAVLERVAEQLGEDQCHRRGAVAGEQHLLEL